MEGSDLHIRVRGESSPAFEVINAEGNLIAVCADRPEAVEVVRQLRDRSQFSTRLPSASASSSTLEGRIKMAGMLSKGEVVQVSELDRKLGVRLQRCPKCGQVVQAFGDEREQKLKCGNCQIRFDRARQELRPQAQPSETTSLMMLGRRIAVPWFRLIAAGAIAICCLVAGWTFYQASLATEEQISHRRIASLAEGVEGEGNDSTTIHEYLTSARLTGETFFMASTLDERSALVRDLERVSPLMKEYYARDQVGQEALPAIGVGHVALATNRESGISA